jgi:hypothetical protein
MFTRRMMIGSATACLGLPAGPLRAQETEEVFPAGAVREDLDAIWSTLHNVSPDPFRTTQPALVEAIYSHARASLVAPTTLRSAWLTIAPVLGALNDGHASLGFNEALNAATIAFPLRLRTPERGDWLEVERDHTGTILPGSRVISIDGVSAAEFLRTTMAAFGGQTPALTRWRVTAAGPWTAVALFGAKPAYHVRWVEPSGTPRDAAISSGANAGPRAPSEPYGFRWLRKDVGLIDYRRCEDLTRFKAFLDTSFAALQTASATALVIDIRRNSGGDSDLNDLLWSYAQAKPFKQFGATIERSSLQLKQAYGRDKYVQIYGEQAWGSPDGAIITQSAAPDANLVVPGPQTVRFQNPVFLLISAATFSSGMSCALAAKDYGLATIVGQETGEPVNGTGELYAMTTPNLKLQAYLTTKVFLAPKPHPDRQGVVPDVPVLDAPVDGPDADADPTPARTLELIGARH